jgi:hypothetical protein
VTRASQLIQEGKPVTRGTLQTVFVYTPFDEVRRLGLRTETETDVRRKFPQDRHARRRGSAARLARRRPSSSPATSS